MGTMQINLLAKPSVCHSLHVSAPERTVCLQTVAIELLRPIQQLTVMERVQAGRMVEWRAGVRGGTVGVRGRHTMRQGRDS